MALPFKVATLPVTPFQQNCTFVWNDATRRGVVVDPGGDVPRILAAVDQLGFRPDLILITHGHLDHAGGAAELRERLTQRARQDDAAALAVPIWGPDERDRFLLDGLETQGQRYGMPGLRNLVPDRWLREGDTVPVAGHDFRVLHCPGHAPGHVVLVQDAARFALVGDVLFRGSIGRTDFPYGDTDALLAAIRDKLLPLGDDMAFVCGHGPGSTIGEERRTNPFLQ